MDLIDKNKLISHLNDWALQEAPTAYGYDKNAIEYSPYDMQKMIYRTIQDAISAVEELPSAEKTGKWKRRSGRYTTGENWYRFICSECGWVIETANEAAAPYHYCPNCGSRMVE